MALRDKLATAVQPYLQPGEQLQVVFIGQSHSQWLAPLVGFIPFLFINRYRQVAVTDRRVLVLDGGHWSSMKPQAVAFELPRTTRLGPGSGIWHRIEAGPEKIRVAYRFFKDLREADRLSGAGATPVG
ncbi:hypothetical protein ABIE44_000418 [Marmoricola sp. OAE513]|uniref:hypothetical protein n=1 Tax=Marmoricola sp. OAE513 TaxID=2817894 RepID=UPI001AEB451A